MDRRNFLRTGSLAMLGSLAVPSWLCLRQYAELWEEQIISLP